MAHKQQQKFFEDLAVRFPERFDNVSRVLEVGSQNINGSIRQYFPNAAEYLGVDLNIAPDVDWAVPGELLELPNSWAEIVVSTECFEHCRDWEKVFTNMIRIAKPRGLVIVTCAAPGRAAHGTTDSDEGSSPFTTTYYKNLGVDNIAEKIKLGFYFSSHVFEINSISHDLYFWGIRSETDIQVEDKYWEDPISRLARAQGQLAQAAARHSAVQAELYNIKDESQQAKTTAEKAKAEAEQAKAEAEQAEAEANEKGRILRELQESTSWKVTKPARRAMDTLRRLFRRKE